MSGCMKTESLDERRNGVTGVGGSRKSPYLVPICVYIVHVEPDGYDGKMIAGASLNTEAGTISKNKQLTKTKWHGMGLQRRS